MGVCVCVCGADIDVCGAAAGLKHQMMGVDVLYIVDDT